jgi:hypothetical protein
MTNHGGKRPGAGKRKTPRAPQAKFSVELDIKRACDVKFADQCVEVTHGNAKGETVDGLRALARGALCVNRSKDIAMAAELIRAIDTGDDTDTQATLCSLRERLLVSLRSPSA